VDMNEKKKNRDGALRRVKVLQEYNFF